MFVAFGRLWSRKKAWYWGVEVSDLLSMKPSIYWRGIWKLQFRPAGMQLSGLWVSLTALSKNLGHFVVLPEPEPSPASA